MLLSSLTASGAAQGQLRAGAAAIDISPHKLPIRIAGNLTEVWADTIHDPLHARALVLDNGSVQLALVVVDSCMMDRELVDAAKTAASQSTGIPTDHMLVSATHTHSAPAVVGCHGTDPHPDYREWLIVRIAEAITKAHNQRAPARIGWGQHDCTEYVHCRRWVMKPGTALTPKFTGHATNQVQMNPGHDNTNKLYQTGPVDPAVTLLFVQTKEGKPLAVFGNYSTHYAGAPGVSSDYFGQFCLEMQQRFQAEHLPFVGLMSNGTSGDANCIDFSKPRRDFDRFTVAKAVANAAMEASRKVTYHDWVPLAAAETRLTFNLRLPSPEETAEAKAYLAQNVVNRPTKTWEENYARETVLLSQWAPTQELKLQALRIGDLGVGAIPCETFGSTGLDIKKGSSFPINMVIGLANGYSGYLPPPDQHKLGGYTTWRARSSCLEVEAEPKIKTAVLELLKKLKSE